MKVLFTEVNLSYAGENLVADILRIIPEIKKVASEYEILEDDRVLVIVLTCPCCYRDRLLKSCRDPLLQPLLKPIIFVSPLVGSGVDRDMYRVNISPPGNNTVEIKAKTINEFFDCFRKVIDQALLGSKQEWGRLQETCDVCEYFKLAG